VVAERERSGDIGRYGSKIKAVRKRNAMFAATKF
jgi:hypothetical protein